ncbi:MAG: hypothetical protein JWL77_270 [Chthonomonadaceae bacterium]|nr:hypothetical protein [Chthonomonadaceae bacterium]
MYDMNITFERFSRRRLAPTVALAIFTLLAAGNAQVCLAQQSSQKAFSSAQEASHALFLAIRNHDEPAIMGILGAGKELVCSGDAGQDKDERAQFLQKYQEMHRLVREPGGTILYIGAENWPFPIPLVSTKGAWRFDAKAGMYEVVCRCIGENEAAAIEACKRRVREEKQHPTTSGNGPMLSHGYYFRSLTSQGGKVPGGAKTTLANGKTTSGFVCVAYPAEYRATGVMTFIVKQNGVVYAKDLGPNTTKTAKALTGHPIVSTWVAAK